MTLRLAVVVAIGTTAVSAVTVSPGRLKAAPTSAAARDYDLHEETTITRTLRFGGTGPRVLDVRNLNGSIRATGSGSSTVDLRAQRRIAADTQDDLRRGEREAVLGITDGAPTIEAIVREPNGPTCGEDWEWTGGWRRRPRYQVTYDITVGVPAGTRLRLCTMNGREITVTGTRGDFEIDNVNGEIAMEDVRGSGSARTVNGRIIATFLDLPRLDAAFTTVNGDVVVSWPDGLDARLRMKTMHGGLFTDFTVSPVDPPAPVAERRNGRFVYRSAQFTEVQVGRGGPAITFETLNGNVRVLRTGR
jgi:hypothetical protein